MKRLLLKFAVISGIFWGILLGCASAPKSPEENLEAAFGEAIKSFTAGDMATAYYKCYGAREDALRAKVPIPEKFAVLTKLTAERYVSELTRQTEVTYYQHGLVLAKFPEERALEIVRREKIDPPELLIVLAQKIRTERQQLFLYYNHGEITPYGSRRKPLDT